MHQLIAELQEKKKERGQVYQRLREREIAKSIYTTLGYRNNIGRKDFFDKLGDGPDILKPALEKTFGKPVSENDSKGLLKELDPAPAVSMFKRGNNTAHEYTR